MAMKRSFSAWLAISCFITASTLYCLQTCSLLRSFHYLLPHSAICSGSSRNNMGLQDNIELHRESKVNNGHGNADRHVILSELQLPSHETVRNARIMDDGGIASAAAVEAEKATATADGDKSEEEGEGEEEEMKRSERDQRNAEEVVAERAVQQIMEELRRHGKYSSARSRSSEDPIYSMQDSGNLGPPPSLSFSSSSCHGRNVHIYDLPARFNAGLLRQCASLLPWLNMCDYFSDSGMGPPVRPRERGPRIGRWYKTHQYALEIIFHERLKRYPCLVADARDADLFYIPYYGGLDVMRWHFAERVTDEARDKLGLQLMRWLEDRPTWGRNGGVDHVLVLGKITWDFRRGPLIMQPSASITAGSSTSNSTAARGWGNQVLLYEGMQNVTKLLIERNPWDKHDVGVPHPTFFHPRDAMDIRTWQEHVSTAPRKHLVSFAGQPRPNQPESIRTHLINQCTNASSAFSSSLCYFLHCTDHHNCFRPEITMDLFIHSEFCLQPPGDSPTRRSIFESLIGGCIPVLFDPYSAYYQYPWHLPEDPAAYSVYIPANDIRGGKVNVVEELRKFPKHVREEMRSRIINEIMPGLVYAKADAKLGEVEDAFLVSLRSLFSKVHERLHAKFATT